VEDLPGVSRICTAANEQYRSRKEITTNGEKKEKAAEGDLMGALTGVSWEKASDLPSAKKNRAALQVFNIAYALLEADARKITKTSCSIRTAFGRYVYPRSMGRQPESYRRRPRSGKALQSLGE